MSETTDIEFRVRFKLRPRPGITAVPTGVDDEVMFVAGESTRNILLDGWSVLANVINGEDSVFYDVADYEVVE